MMMIMMMVMMRMTVMVVVMVAVMRRRRGTGEKLRTLTRGSGTKHNTKSIKKHKY